MFKHKPEVELKGRVKKPFVLKPFKLVYMKIRNFIVIIIFISSWYKIVKNTNKNQPKINPFTLRF